MSISTCKGKSLRLTKSWDQYRQIRGRPSSLCFGGGEEVNEYIHKLCGHIIKNSDVGIPGTHQTEECYHSIPKANCGELVESILGGTNLSYVVHRGGISKSNSRERKEI